MRRRRAGRGVRGAFGQATGDGCRTEITNRIISSCNTQLFVGADSLVVGNSFCLMKVFPNRNRPGENVVFCCVFFFALPCFFLFGI